MKYPSHCFGRFKVKLTEIQKQHQTEKVEKPFVGSRFEK